ncbi:hypothetical protein [Euzebya sp.]|uniref:hypothetical protein n=1 Tax=Euzebya sp. TaxID=1971409 RepID=UPI003517F457
MPTTDVSTDTLAILRVLGDLQARHTVPTVQAAAIGAGLSYMDAYDLVNRAFTDGLISQNLQLTDAGRKAIA